MGSLKRQTGFLRESLMCITGGLCVRVCMCVCECVCYCKSKQKGSWAVCVFDVCVMWFRGEGSCVWRQWDPNGAQESPSLRSCVCVCVCVDRVHVQSHLSHALLLIYSESLPNFFIIIIHIFPLWLSLCHLSKLWNKK